MRDSWLTGGCGKGADEWGSVGSSPRTAVNVIKFLGLGVIRFEFVVADRPGRGDSAKMLQLAKVLFSQTKQRRAVEFRVAADVIVGMRVQFFAGGIQPGFFGLVFAIEVDCFGIPVIFFPRNPSAPFQNQNPFSAGRELSRNVPPPAPEPMMMTSK